MPPRTRSGGQDRRGAGLLPSDPTPTAVLLAALAGAPPLVFWRATDSVFGAPKLLLVAVLAVAFVLVPRPSPRGVTAPAPPWPPVAVATAVFLALVTIATITSDVPALSVTGHHGRFSGLVAYALGGLLLVRVASTRDLDTLGWLVPGIGIGAAVVSLYGAFQRLGFDVIGWSYAVDITGSASTLGNPNFAAAHAALGAAVGTGVLLSRPGRRLRVAAAVLVFLAVLGLLAANAVQGYLAALAGVVAAVVADQIRRHPARQVQLAVGAALAAVLGAVAVGAGAAGVGPLTVIANRVGTQVRIWDWQTALAIGRDHPLTGVGFDRFSGYANAYRPGEAASLLGPETLLDTPHNVPLSMLVGGGFPLLVAYVAILVLTAWALVVGLARLEGRRHQLLGTLGAAWVAYQVQSFVSIDVPSLLTTHVVLAGAIVALAFPPEARSVPGLTAATWRRSRTPVTVVAGVALVGLLVLPTLRLVWADAAAGRSRAAFAAGDAGTAVEQAERSVARGGWEPRYHEQLAFARGELGDGQGALDALLAATAVDPRALSPQLNTARLAAALGELDLAARRYRTVLELEPHHVPTHEEAAAVIAAAEGEDAALELLDELVQRRPDAPEARELRDRAAAGGLRAAPVGE